MSEIIRPWRMDDADALAAVIGNPKVQEMLRDGLPYPYTAGDAREFISAMLGAGEGSVYPFAIALGDECVGSISVTRGGNVHRLTGELGYCVAEERWGRGLCNAAVREICAYVFENTDILRIYATPYAHNAASCRVLEKAGFTCEGTLRAAAIKQGVVRDMRMYALLRGE